MTEDRFVATAVLAGLKDFQRQTVDYVFERLFAEAGPHRFLVADEVGLGKTLVARGVIARALEHLQDRVNRVDVIYVCSNAAIAAQNVNRLNVSGQRGFAIASRLTLLPLQVQRLAANKVNFISFTPGTTFDLGSRGGIVEERALLYRMLKGATWHSGEGLLNLLQGPVRKRERWRSLTIHGSAPIDEELAANFRAAVDGDPKLVARLADACARFAGGTDVSGHDSDMRYALIGALRNRLAHACLDALEPDLVVLDEFQRFRNLLDGHDEAAELARALFSYPEVRTLLLSATPYKMMSLDHEGDDDHYPDFLRTLGFLYDDDAVVDTIRRQIGDYRAALLALADGAVDRIAPARDALQDSLLKVMCRTERVGMTARLDAMLVEPPGGAAPIEPEDLDHARVADRLARAVGAHEPLEYWKSSPYLLNFLKHYDLRRRLDATASAPAADVLDILRGAQGSVLERAWFEAYDEIPAGNPRMRALFDDTLDQGLWRLLWMPPSLPYTVPTGAYAGVPSVTKALVFSSWNLVPDAIAALATYEAERRMVANLDRPVLHSELYDRLKPLLRFARGRDDRLTGMPILAWMLPSPALVRAVDPLCEAIAATRGGEPLTVDRLVARTEARVEALLAALPGGAEGPRADERWYWAAPVLLEADGGLRRWLEDPAGWGAAGAAPEDDAGDRFRDHVALLAEASRGGLALGPRPDDLARVLAELALAGPGCCALRALGRVTPGLVFDDARMLTAAARIAAGFRTLFNLPETSALLRGGAEDAYWRLALAHGLEGNLQALLDEQVHVLVEQQGLSDHPAAARADGVSRALAEGLSIRTAQISVDELRVDDGVVVRESFNTRCRFALRFGDLREGQETAVARAGTVQAAFNSPFRPFVLASTSIGQEGLDFHTWCHAVVHWNLPSNPVDLEQREGRVHRYKGHAVRKNIAERYGLAGLDGCDTRSDPWTLLFERARSERAEGSSDIVPFWIFEEGAARIERRVPLIPFSREVGQLAQLKRNLALYRLVFGQPRQEDLLAHLGRGLAPEQAHALAARWRINLAPPP